MRYKEVFMRFTESDMGIHAFWEAGRFGQETYMTGILRRLNRLADPWGFIWLRESWCLNDYQDDVAENLATWGVMMMTCRSQVRADYPRREWLGRSFEWLGVWVFGETCLPVKIDFIRLSRWWGDLDRLFNPWLASASYQVKKNMISLCKRPMHTWTPYIMYNMFFSLANSSNSQSFGKREKSGE